jgi:hypothetical protein
MASMILLIEFNFMSASLLRMMFELVDELEVQTTSPPAEADGDCFGNVVGQCSVISGQWPVSERGSPPLIDVY